VVPADAGLPREWLFLHAESELRSRLRSQEWRMTTICAWLSLNTWSWNNGGRIVVVPCGTIFFFRGNSPSNATSTSRSCLSRLIVSQYSALNSVAGRQSGRGSRCITSQSALWSGSATILVSDPQDVFHWPDP